MARPWNPDFTYSDRERWVCIYPVYLNSKRSLSEGRRIPRGNAIDNPTIDEIREVCKFLNLNIGVEEKVHPREPDKYMYRGRVRVQLKNDDGIPVSSQFPDRITLFIHIAELIGKLKTRQQASGAQQGAGEDNQPNQPKKQQKQKKKR